MRDSDGLALSSRNQYLSPEQLNMARNLNKHLKSLADNLKNNTSITTAIEHTKEKILNDGFDKIDYLCIKDADSLLDIVSLEKNINARLFVAAYIGGVRLIDNISVCL